MKPLPMIRATAEELRAKVAKYCSYGDTVHYSPVPKFFQGCEGSFLYDRDDRPYLDLQMWYSAVSFGYRNKAITDAVNAHLDQLAQLAFPYCYRCPYDKKFDTCEYYCVNQVERLFETEYNSFWDSRANEPEFVAFYVEPVQATGGYIIPPPGYFSRLKKILDERKILLVDDEIQMGFFRTGKFWAIEHFGVKPNIVVFGKAMTNGLNPISGVWAQETLISPEKFPPGATHSTFSSNPLGTAAALATLEWIEQQDYEKKVAESGVYFLQQLRDLKNRHATIGDVSGLGLALRIEVTKPDRFTPDKALTDRIFEAGLAGDIPTARGPMGLVLDIGGHYKNVFTLAPSLDITREEIDLGIELLDYLFAQCTKHQT